MRAIDLAEQIPTVTTATTGAEAARIVAEYRLPGLVVLGEDGSPYAVIPGSQIMGLILPAYVRDDPGLAHAFDELSADELCERLATATIGELLAAQRIDSQKLPSVLPEDTIVEMAAVMVLGRQPIILVRDKSGYHGVVLLSRLLAAIAAKAGEDSALVQRRLTRDVIDKGTDQGSNA